MSNVKARADKAVAGKLRPSEDGTRKARLVPAGVVHAAWRKEPGFQAAYDALEEEFAIMAALIEARTKAGISQGEIAKRMSTTQPAICDRSSGGHGAPGLAEDAEKLRGGHRPPRQDLARTHRAEALSGSFSVRRSRQE